MRDLLSAIFGALAYAAPPGIFALLYHVARRSRRPRLARAAPAFRFLALVCIPFSAAMFLMPGFAGSEHGRVAFIEFFLPRLALAPVFFAALLYLVDRAVRHGRRPRLYPAAVLLRNLLLASLVALTVFVLLGLMFSR